MTTRAYSKNQTTTNSVVAGKEDILIILQKQTLRLRFYLLPHWYFLLEAQYAKKCELLYKTSRLCPMGVKKI